jgi:hypothetical protein
MMQSYKKFPPGTIIKKGDCFHSVIPCFKGYYSFASSSIGEKSKGNLYRPKKKKEQ